MASKKAIAIRNATAEDEAGILDCLREAFEPYRASYTPEGFRDTVLTPETIHARLSGMAVLVATDEDGKIVGTVAGKLVNREEGHLRGMAVLSQWQGHGIAERLLAAIESHLQSQGCKRITLDTTEPLKRAARFYERNGYRLSGRVTEFFGMPLYEYVKTFKTR
jgi:GNAT superfamily N-acetyltransferase